LIIMLPSPFPGIPEFPIIIHAPLPLAIDDFE
jgi:hypothetical protein